MRSIGSAVQPGARYPFARVLPGRNMWSAFEATREQILRNFHASVIQPSLDSRAGLLRQLELHGEPGLFLDHDGTIPCSAADADVLHLQAHQIAAPQLAIDAQVEHGQVSLAALELQ